MTEIKKLMDRRKALIKARKRALGQNNLSYADTLAEEIKFTQERLKNAREVD